MSEPEYITVEAAADLLHLTTRQTHRYAERGRLKVRKAGRRSLFNRADVEALAADLGTLNAPRPEPRSHAKTDLVPAGEMLDYLRDRDRRLDELQRQLTQAAAEVGRLQGALEQQRLLTADADDLRERLRVAEAERDALKAEQAQRRPWWKRLLGS